MRMTYPTTQSPLPRVARTRENAMRTHLALNPLGSMFLATLCAVAASSCGGDGSDRALTPDIYTVSRGDLKITINEDAEIKSAVERTIKSNIEGQATIIYLIPEGTFVEEGQRLVELDLSDLVDRLATHAIDVERA